MFRLNVLALLLAVFCAVPFGKASDSAALPADLTAAILVKLLELELNVRKSQEIRIHVVDNFQLAEGLQKMVGARSGSARLTQVSFGEALPENGTDVLFFSSGENLESLVDYTRQKGVLSVTNDRWLVESGATLAIYNDEGLPGILLNHESSRREGRKWRPEILEVAEVYGE